MATNTPMRTNITAARELRAMIPQDAQERLREALGEGLHYYQVVAAGIAGEIISGIECPDWFDCPEHFSSWRDGLRAALIEAMWDLD